MLGEILVCTFAAERTNPVSFLKYKTAARTAVGRRSPSRALSCSGDSHGARTRSQTSSGISESSWMARVLITGGAGFIGSHAADALLEAGYEVRLLDNLTTQVHGTSRKPPAYLNHDAQLIIGDV